MRNPDFSSWQAMAFSFVGIALVTLIGVVTRLVLMQTVRSVATGKTGRSTNGCERSWPLTRPLAAHSREASLSTRGTRGS